MMRSKLWGNRNDDRGNQTCIHSSRLHNIFYRWTINLHFAHTHKFTLFKSDGDDKYDGSQVSTFFPLSKAPILFSLVVLVMLRMCWYEFSLNHSRFMAIIIVINHSKIARTIWWSLWWSCIARHTMVSSESKDHIPFTFHNHHR